MKKLRKDELLDQQSYLHKIKAQEFGTKADTFRYEAYNTRSIVNGLFAKALLLKEQACKVYRAKGKKLRSED